MTVAPLPGLPAPSGWRPDAHQLTEGLRFVAQSVSGLYVAHDSVISFLPIVGAKDYSLGRYFTLSLFAENSGHFQRLLEPGSKLSVLEY